MKNIRIVALDIGVKTIGIALTDPLWLFANPLKTVNRGQSIMADLTELKLVLARFEITAFVIGWPLTMDGHEGEMTRMVKGFEKKLKTVFPEIPVYREDERLSTKEAVDITLRRTKKITQEKKAGRIDAVAAAVILNNFMKNSDFAELRGRVSNIL